MLTSDAMSAISSEIDQKCCAKSTVKCFSCDSEFLLGDGGWDVKGERRREKKGSHLTLDLSLFLMK